MRGLVLVSTFAVVIAWAGQTNIAGPYAQRLFHDHVLAPFGWFIFSLSVLNPAPIIAEKSRSLVFPALCLGWLATAIITLFIGNPSRALEYCWRAMTARFSLFQISVFGSMILHLLLLAILNIWPMILQNTRSLQKYKIQQGKQPPTSTNWKEAILHIIGSQLFVQGPLISLQYCFIEYFSIPYDFDSIPGLFSLAWRIALAYVVDDSWVYFGHRFLHHKRIYKHIHKIHHTYTSPFGPVAEYEHPVETITLGVGFFLACMFFTNHLAFMWAWLYCRLLVTYDSHSGYDLPFSLFRAILPCYNGAREHDWHHEFFNGNFAPTFVWWDRFFGTNLAFERFEKQRRARECAKRSEAFESRGDAVYAEGEGVRPRAGEIEGDPARVPFSTCLVTGSEGMVGARLVAMLAARGATRILCLDIIDGPTPPFVTLAAHCFKEYGSELVYIQGDITDMSDLDGRFQGVEAVFHLAALVGPFYKHELFDQVNHWGAKNVLEAFLNSGGSSHGPHAVLVDCSTPSTRYPVCGEWEGLMESEMSYQDQIHEYATTKAKGELAILSANGSTTTSGKTLVTCAVAPHQVYAPEDKLFLPAMLQTASSGKLRIFGKGDNTVSFTHADNIAHALVIAAAKLWKEGSQSRAAGEFFVVTDTGAHNFWDMVDMAIEGCGLPSLRSRMHLSPSLLALVANIGSIYTRLIGRFVKLTPFTLRMLVINRTFCTAKARHILGYKPVISFEDGWAETLAAAKAAYFTARPEHIDPHTSKKTN